VQLVEVLNEDYAEYISLSGKLGSVDGAILRMRQPLMDIQVGVGGCSSRGLTGHRITSCRNAGSAMRLQPARLSYTCHSLLDACIRAQQQDCGSTPCMQYC
jgi:hypothetical protein